MPTEIIVREFVPIPEGTEEWKEARKMVDGMILKHKVDAELAEARAKEERGKRIAEGDTVKFFCIDKFLEGEVEHIVGKYVSVRVKGVAWKVQISLCKKVMFAELRIAEKEKKLSEHVHHKYYCEECDIGLDILDKCPACGGMPAFA